MRGISAVITGALLLGVSASAQDPEPPNVVMIVADDLNLMISPLGDPNAITPNFAELASRGVLFDNCSNTLPAV